MTYTCWVDMGPSYGPFEKRQYSTLDAANAAECHARYWFNETYDEADDAHFIVVVSDDAGAMSRWDVYTEVERSYRVREAAK